MTCLLPVTDFVEILRGIVQHGAVFVRQWPQVAGLAICFVAILWLSVTCFRTQLD